MTAAITVVLTAASALAVLPCAILFVQCLVAVASRTDDAATRRRGDAATEERSGVRSPVCGVEDRESAGCSAIQNPKSKIQNRHLAVIVPAHDEENVIGSTLDSIRAQLMSGDRLLVVADNCTDATARIAQSHGAEVLTRQDPVRRGKGYALQAALAQLRERPPAVVVVIDADCVLAPGCLDALCRQVVRTSRPAQACYLMLPPQLSGRARPRDALSSLAVLVKNRVRPLAMGRLGLPCLLTGSGCAFSWESLQVRSFEGANIVEDMQLSVDLALTGFAPQYCDRARVMAELPADRSAFLSQRRRWEHGHLQTIFSQVPRLFVAFLRTGKPELAGMLLDLAVPPVSLLSAMMAGMLVAASIWGLAGGSLAPAAIVLAGVVSLCGSLGLAWWGFARDQVPFRLLLGIPAYVAVKLPLYATFLVRRERSWVRTARTSAGETIEPPPIS